MKPTRAILYLLNMMFDTLTTIGWGKGLPPVQCQSIAKIIIGLLWMGSYLTDSENFN